MGPVVPSEAPLLPPFLPGTEFCFSINFASCGVEICADLGMENYCFDLSSGRKVNVNNGSQVELKQNTYHLYMFWKAYSPLEITWPLLKDLGFSIQPLDVILNHQIANSHNSC